jgi:hypothetical protein
MLRLVAKTVKPTAAARPTVMVNFDILTTSEEDEF